MTGAPTESAAAGARTAPADQLPDDRPLDLLGVGIGPFNLSLAALADGVPGLRTAFVEQRPAFHWHPGLLIEGTTLQVPFLADLVSLVEPASRWSFLSYLKTQERLFPFYFAERFHIDRAEYDAYCRWVSEQLPSCRFGHRAESVRWDAGSGLFEVECTRLDATGRWGAAFRQYARHVVLAVGTEPAVPEPLRPLAEDAALPVLHSADYLAHRAELLSAGHVTVVGSGQSGAEVFLDLLRRRPAGREGLTWLARTPAFAPMEYSKLGLEQFTPDYTRYFHGLSEPERDRLLPEQWQLYKGISAQTLSEIHDELYRRTLDGGRPDAVLLPGVAVRSARWTAGSGERPGEHRIELDVEHRPQDARGRLRTDAVVLATGYAERPLDGLIQPLSGELARDAAGRPQVDRDHRLVLNAEIGGSVFVQNAERHTHGVGAPDLGLGAWRSATILNALTGRTLFSLPRRTAFTTFGLSRERPDGAAERTGVPTYDALKAR